MSFKIELTQRVLDDIEKFEKAGNYRLLRKIQTLFQELKEHPTTGTGKPELLKHYEQPTWSRRISRQHRLIYTIEDMTVTVIVLSAWGHYDDK